MAHIALIGDSVFDNGAYIVTQPDVRKTKSAHDSCGVKAAPLQE